MSTYLRFLLVALTHALIFSCASAPRPVQTPTPVADGPQAIEFEAPSPVSTPPPNRYAPTRSSNSPRYSWQSATPKKCDSEPIVKEADAPIVLKFSGSVGVFPPIPDEVIDAQQAKAPEPIDTWGGAEPPSSEIRSPDLVVAGLRPAFRRCFSRWLDAKADAEGSVRFALELGCAGDVQAISADVQGVDETTLACLFTVVGPAQFGPPANGHTTLQVPVVFKNASR